MPSSIYRLTSTAYCLCFSHVNEQIGVVNVVLNRIKREGKQSKIKCMLVFVKEQMAALALDCVQLSVLEKDMKRKIILVKTIFY